MKNFLFVHYYSEEMLIHFFHPAHHDHFNTEFLFAQTFLVVFGNNDFFKAQFLRFGDPLVDPVNSSDFPA